MESASPRNSDRRWLAPLMTFGVLAVVAAGLMLDLFGVPLGTPLPPLFATWDPDFNLLGLLGCLILISAAVALTPRLIAAELSPWRFIVGLVAIAISLRLAVGALREGVDGWYSVFGLDAEAGNEYLPALPALDLGWATFLDRFAEISPSLPIHPSAHPPGLLLLTDLLGIDSARGFAALVIIAGVAGAPLTYVLGRNLLDEQSGRVAGLLFAFAPSGILYGVASADALFATLGLLAAIGLLARPILARAAGAVALAVGSFFSWALLALGAFAVIASGQRDRLNGMDDAAAFKRALRLGVGAGLVTTLFYGALFAAYGFDPLGTLKAASEAYELGISQARPFLFWVLGSPAAMLFAAGPAIVWFAARSLGEAVPAAIGIWAVVLIAALIGFSKAETERIWLFMVPLLCVAAAATLPPRYLPGILALLGCQALLMETLLDTVW